MEQALDVLHIWPTNQKAAREGSGSCRIRERFPAPGKESKNPAPNPWRVLRLPFQKDTSLVLSISAMFYMTYYIVQASIPELLERIYGFDETTVGLCYITIGFEVVVGGYVNGLTHISPVCYNL